MAQVATPTAVPPTCLGHKPSMVYGWEMGLHYLWGLVDSAQVVGKIPAAQKQEIAKGKGGDKRPSSQGRQR